MSIVLGFLAGLSTLGLCTAVAYVFMRGLLGVFYEIATWVVHVLD